MADRGFVRRAWVAALAAMCAGAGPLGAQIAPAAEPVPKEERLAWFRDAKFGMFIHWGPYSRLAGEWEGRRVPVGENAEWIMQKLRIPVERYREMARRFDPVRFDAARWCSLARDAGMRYLVITAKHHDGFAMYDSDVGEYDIVDWTPFRRDPLKELSEACPERGVRFGFYYSHREDWNEPFAYGNDWDFDFDPEEEPAAFESYLGGKAKPQLRELMTRYGPIALVWFDRGMYTPEQGQAFADLVHGLQPRTLVSGRVGHYDQELLGDYQSLSDNGMPIGGIEEYWESPGTLNDTWGYSRFDTGWKTPAAVVERLARIVGAGGNYLLNVGPTGEGEIPRATVEILEEVGRWVNRNGESIYGTTGSPFGPLPWGYATVKGERVFLHVVRWPDDGRLRVPGLRNEIRTAYPLLDPARPLRWERSGSDVALAVPAAPLDSLNTVLVLEIAGAPVVDPPVVAQGAGGSIELDYLAAVTEGEAVKRFNRKGGFHVSRWTGPDDLVRWHVDVERPGRYRVRIAYAAREEWAGAPYTVEIGGETLAARVEPTGGWYEYRELDLGTVELERAGRHVLTIRPARPLPGYLMYLKGLRLAPAP